MAGWTQELARHGAELMSDRSEAVSLLSGPFSERAGQLGLEGEAALAYKPRSRGSTPEELRQELEAALSSDLERGFTTHGPHRDELSIELDRKALRRFGSQGQQRLALLALLLAERDALAAARTGTPMLLLDDVMSELDGSRRDLLLDLLEHGGQALITTADPAATGLDREFDRVRVAPGELAVLERAAA